MSDEYKCNHCKLEFKTRSGVWKHNNKYHTIKLTENSSNTSKNTSESSKTSENMLKNEKYICKLCDKKLSRIDNLKRHEKTCKNTNKKENEEIELLKNLIHEMKNEITELKKTKNTNNTNNNTKNINNGNFYNGKTINNITINAPGHELMTLTKEDLDIIFKKNILSVITYIENTNFNKEKRYNHNFCATNQNGKYLLHYDEKTSSIKSAKKKYFYHDIISNAIAKIDTSYKKYKNKFNKDKQIQIEDIITRLKEIKEYNFNNKTLKGLFDELNLLCYNSREIILDTWSNTDISTNIIDTEYKELFLPVQEYLAIYNNEMKKTNTSDKNKRKQKKKSYLDTSSDNEIEV